ncbi:pyridoxamine 5'-phosphate oxidase family protein [Aquimarina sp. U1-2]|uniref:pyridoxamine 5'-phosphate oxidase family protein n=1 Tax=Aquimarina sp. U1-2 TaxID=2823141 RepID=UPI001AEC93D1|nr:pyridoxamine 5'-phosphate oxidase family protein [Aquimarina sp. U1-2]MBP2830613.1 pyridoxamine 5'-phosphate oxidase family protein [Aquimarina sp. U1-2]
MTEIIFSTVLKDLKNATITNSHPFRYFTLGTSSINGTPRLRTVVLREIDEHLNLMVYTDKRSKKITHINEHNTVSLLFFDSEKLIQLSIRAKAKLITDDITLKRIWEHIPIKSRKDYTTKLAPGKEINNPEQIDYLEEKHFLTAIKLIPDKIEYLRLKRPTHIRVLYEKENDEWKGSFLVP